MKKIIKVILIILFYVIMFSGIITWICSGKHETKCQCKCELATAAKVKEVSLEIDKTEELVVENTEENIVEEKPEEIKPEPAVVTPKPGKETYQAFAYDLVINQYIWSEEDYQALINLWERESNWNPDAVNKSSGACNIPQALPCSKISNVYGDNSWQSGIKWGLQYIKNRYGTPTNAWQHFQNKNWY